MGFCVWTWPKLRTVGPCQRMRLPRLFLPASRPSMPADASPLLGAPINVDRTVRLAERLVGDGTFVVFPSSSLVFDGSVPFCPADAKTNPTTEYGRQKAEAERRLLSLGNKVAIVRLSKVLCHHTALFAKWRVSLQGAEPIQPFSDMVLSPLHISLVTEVLLQIAKSRSPGIFQLSADRDVTYADAARRWNANLGCDPSLLQPRRAAQCGMDLESIPAHTTLDASRLGADFGLAAPSPWEAIDAILKPPPSTEESSPQCRSWHKAPATSLSS